MKKKVLLAITKSNFGGAQRYVYDTARTLPRERYDVAVVCGGEGVLVQKLRAANVRVIPLLSLGRDVRIFSDIAALFALARIVYRERPDILHLNSSKMGIMGALVGRLLHVPRILFTAHGWAFNESRFPLSQYIIYLFALCTVLWTHKTIAVSDAVAQDMHALRRKIVVIRNGIDAVTLLERREARETLAQWPTEANEVWIGAVAELHHIKGLNFAIQAFKEYAVSNTTAHLILIGEGDGRSSLEDEIERQRLENRVHLVGFLDNAAAYLQAFDVLLISSLSEGLSYVPLEAGVARLPVIATNVGGIPEIIEDGASGLLVPARDAAALSAALERLTRDTGLRNKIATALHEKVTTRFSLSEMLRQTLLVYDGA